MRIFLTVFCLTLTVSIGCKSVCNWQLRTEKDMVKKVEITTLTYQNDTSFTLGFSEGDSKVIDILDVSISGISPK